MNWLDIGRVSNADGGKDILLARNERGARIDWRTGEVWLMNPKVAEPFADFLAVERWLTLRDMPTADKPAPAAPAPAPAPAEPEPAAVPDAGPLRDSLPAFQQKVDDCLAKAEGGQELLETKQAFEAGSEPYLEASTALSKTALELDVSPAMVATFHVSAFAALAETAGADKLERVAASLHAAARQIRASAATA
ncbi:hypothetical protein [Janthinobacterium sp. 1_2014MBL_MicDiv]|uniref:hypothetical protein n=1 Tax=Janthinobacterium sp. 1_2014MBL_MicDiv TaxID=1644131 RepID=UPI0018DD12BF|nr:hypothetical protein [Janthinobacterium sp. 1_2014MBL_MicDiv]